MQKKKEKLVAEGNAFYEIDLDCLEEKKLQEEKKEEKKEKAKMDK